ncbi:MAG: hypothetical protein JNM52_10775, partial [Betaproteobacteria bacterium]|nr:hypothetical protein [Betaproteobacteria bacterium]
MSASLPVPSPTPAPIQREQSLISPRLQNALLFGIGIAAIVAVTAVAVMWGKTPEYKL